MVRKIVLVVAVALVMVLALSGAALAASPQDIYDDYAADNKLDGTYTDAELQAYLGDAAIQQYGNPAVVQALNGVVQGLLSAPDDTDDGRDTFPLTGFELLLTGMGAVALVGGGLGLRVLTHKR